MLEPERVTGFATAGQARFGVRVRPRKESEIKGTVTGDGSCTLWLTDAWNYLYLLSSEKTDVILIVVETLEKIQDVGSYTLTLDDLLPGFSLPLTTHHKKKKIIILSEQNTTHEQFSW